MILLKTIKKGFKFSIIIIVFILVLYGGIYLYALLTPKLSINSANSFYLYDKNADLYSGNNSDAWVGLDEISPYLIDATISIEDKHFYKHHGFDYLRIVKAFYNNFITGSKAQGASTISQQYTKNLFLDFDKTWSRKLEEAWLTIRLEAHYDKDEILEGYLNTINYGGIFGIENASQYYFNKSASELDLAEASILAGIPKWPSKYSPLIDEKASKSRQELILNSMVKNEYITEIQADKAYDKELTYIGNTETYKLNTLMYYQDAVISELKTINTIPDSFLATGGLKIYTNLDMEAQKFMEESINNNMKNNQELEVATVAMEPTTGKVIALAGGRDYNKSQFNRVTSSKRQVGSTLKPFLYYSALENGFTPSTTFTSEKTTFAFGENKTYSPSNYGDTYPNTDISMAAALAYSDNIYAVKTHLFLGEETLVETLKRVGITSELSPIPSLALGTKEINMLEMMTAYGTLANEGYKNTAYLIEKVEDINGNILYEHKKSPENVLNKSTTFVLNDMLNNCYSADFIDYTYPTCINISPKLTKKYAVKTGSTNTDHLIFGYNKDVLVGVWTGYDDNKKTTSSDGLINKNVWADIVENYLKDKETSWYTAPKNVVGVLIEPVSGNLATNDSKKKKLTYYIKGTEPYVSNEDLDDLIPTIKENNQ